MHAAISTTAPGQFTPAMISEILRYVPPQPPYEKWILVVSAVASVLPEQEAVPVLASWSPEYVSHEYESKVRQRLSKVGVGTLIAMAKEHGFDARAFARKWRQTRIRTGPHGASWHRPTEAASLPSPRKHRQYLLRKGTPSELEALAKLRRFTSVAGLPEMQEARCLAFCDSLTDLDEGGRWTRVTSWIATDPTRRNESARRLDGRPWRCLRDAKSRCISGPGSKGWPLGVTLSTPGLRLDVAEGEGDFLTLWHLHTLCRSTDALPICLLGTCASFAQYAAELQPYVANRVVQIFAHQDPSGAGQDAARKWANLFYELAAAEVRIKDLSAWLKESGTDLNDIVATLARYERADGLCPGCLRHNIIAPAGGPTCQCAPYAWPAFTAEQVAEEVERL